MSRGQKRQYNAYTEYYEQDFVGLRDNNHNQGQNQGGRSFYSNGRGGGGGGGRGGMRKHQQPRICYVNAEFLNQSVPDFHSAMAMNRRRGWGGGVVENADASTGNNRHQHQTDNRVHSNNIILPDIRLEEDNCETSRDTITDIVTVPSSGRKSEDNNRNLDFENGNGNSNKKGRSRPRSRQTNVRDASVSLRKKRRPSEPEVDRRGDHKRHRKTRPSTKTRNNDDSGDVITLLSSPSDVEIEDEDLRYTIVRQKIVRNKFRREPGEILDTDESSSGSSPKSEDKELRKRNRSSSGSNKNDKSSAAALTKTSKASDRAHSSQEVEDLETDSRPITAETLSQDTIASVFSRAENDQDQAQGCSDKHCTPTSTNGGISDYKNVEFHDDDRELLSRSQDQTQNFKTNAESGQLETEMELSKPADVPLPPPSAPSSARLFIISDAKIRSPSPSSTKFGIPGGVSKTSTMNIRPSSASAAMGKSRPACRQETLRSLTPAKPKGNRSTNALASDDFSTKQIDSYWKLQVERVKKENETLSKQLQKKDLELKRQAKLEEEKDSKIKVLRGRKTRMENDMEEMKSNLSKTEKKLKDAEQKVKKLELELKLKTEEVDAFKQTVEPMNDTNKTDVQLIFAMAYQDRLFVEMEKVKTAFEVEVIRLQEYYEARLAHYRNQGLHPGPYMGIPSNSFPKGCVVTPLNIGQPISVGHQEQNSMSRTETRSGQQSQMGLFTHLGNPENVGVPQGMPRTRLPMFINPIIRRVQQGLEMQTQSMSQTLQSLQYPIQNSSSNPATSNSNSVNNNSNQTNHSSTNNNTNPPVSQNSSFGRN